MIIYKSTETKNISEKNYNVGPTSKVFPRASIVISPRGQCASLGSYFAPKYLRTTMHTKLFRDKDEECILWPHIFRFSIFYH